MCYGEIESVDMGLLRSARRPPAINQTAPRPSQPETPSALGRTYLKDRSTHRCTRDSLVSHLRARGLGTLDHQVQNTVLQKLGESCYPRGVD